MASKLAAESVRERVAVMIGWRVGKSISGFPIYYPPPPRGDGERIERELPPFDTSLDACREVLLWVGKQHLRTNFSLALMDAAEPFEGSPAGWVWNTLNQTPLEICEAALAVGEKR